MTDPLARAIGGTVDRAHHRAIVVGLGSALAGISRRWRNVE